MRGRRDGYLRTGERRPAAGQLIVLGALLIALAGCTTSSGGPAGALSRALDQCSSATSSVELSMNLLIKGKATSAVSATTAEDMRKEILGAQKQATELKTDTGQERKQQAAVLDLMNRTAQTVISAEHAVADDDAASIQAAARELKSRTGELTSMSDSLKAEQ